jgi:hypothetical protein
VGGKIVEEADGARWYLLSRPGFRQYTWEVLQAWRPIQSEPECPPYPAKMEYPTEPECPPVLKWPDDSPALAGYERIPPISRPDLRRGDYVRLMHKDTSKFRWGTVKYSGLIHGLVAETGSGDEITVYQFPVGIRPTPENGYRWAIDQVWRKGACLNEPEPDKDTWTPTPWNREPAKWETLNLDRSGLKDGDWVVVERTGDHGEYELYCGPVKERRNNILNTKAGAISVHVRGLGEKDYDWKLVDARRPKPELPPLPEKQGEVICIDTYGSYFRDAGLWRKIRGPGPALVAAHELWPRLQAEGLTWTLQEIKPYEHP